MANRNHGAQRATAGSARRIFVTGASTGIGRAIVEYLAARGDHLFAGARSDRALGELGRLQNVVPVRLDVTQAESVDAAVAHVRGLTDTLDAIWDKTDPHDARLDGSIFAARARAFGRLMLERARTGGRPPATIARAVHRVLGSRRPRPRYLVTEANLMTRIAGILPDRWLDFAISRAIRGGSQ